MMKSKATPYFLSPTAVEQLRNHKAWSMHRFGRAVTKTYFEDIDKGLQNIAKNYKRFADRSKVSGTQNLLLYPVHEHYIVFVPMHDGIPVAAILGQAQDIPNILKENAEIFRHEMRKPVTRKK